MYRAPVSEMLWTLRHAVGFGGALAESAWPDLSDDVAEAILEEAGRFAADEIAPLNRIGDTDPPRLADGCVAMPPGWREVYGRWRDAGWNAVAAPVEEGGQGLPAALCSALLEVWNGASMAFGIGPVLTMGAVDALVRHASLELRDAWLPNLVSGEWMATMNLTEAQAGSDLGALATRAERADDGTYRIVGEKIYITYGEHDLTGNIVHLVLARLAEAPAGPKGISMFLVPKVLPNGSRNDVVCTRLEEKLGIHGSPTCTMRYGDAGTGAVGWLVGEENHGLACMFTMMNKARLAVGLQGVGIAERALQQASAYAAERRQGRAPGQSGMGMSPISEHPDVQRMLMTMRGLTAASRAICYVCAHMADMATTPANPAPDASQVWQDHADLLTPVAKAFSTDAGIEVASLGIQVHGGAGYIEATGAAQHFRDARIAAIYEGTNGIQAIDLVTRKLPRSGGEPVRGYIGELRRMAERARASNRADLGRTGIRLVASVNDLQQTTEHLLGLLTDGQTAAALAGATPYLRLFGLTAGGCYLAKSALASSGDAGPDAALRIRVARFFAERLCPETAALRMVIEEGAGALSAASSLTAA